MRSACKEYVKEISINDQKGETFIDTGSDVCLIRADQYIRVDTPKLEKKTIRFRGTSSGGNVTLDEFDAIVIIDKRNYSIRIHIVSDMIMKYKLLIGADFLKIVQILQLILERLLLMPRSPFRKERDS
jgi:predicted aspartyl protease